jgi:hypothetical protein
MRGIHRFEVVHETIKKRAKPELRHRIESLSAAWKMLVSSALSCSAFVISPTAQLARSPPSGAVPWSGL